MYFSSLKNYRAWSLGNYLSLSAIIYSLITLATAYNIAFISGLCMVDDIYIELVVLHF